MSRHVIDTEILQELINKVKTLPYEQVAELLSKTITNAKQVLEQESEQPAEVQEEAKDESQ